MLILYCIRVTLHCIFSGPVGSGLINKFGCRFVCFSGGILGSLGFILSSVAPNVMYLYFTFGALSGWYVVYLLSLC